MIKWIKIHKVETAAIILGIGILWYMHMRHAFAATKNSNQKVIDPLGDFVKQAPIFNLDRTAKEDKQAGLESPVDLKESPSPEVLARIFPKLGI